MHIPVGVVAARFEQTITKEVVEAAREQLSIGHFALPAPGLRQIALKIRRNYALKMTGWDTGEVR